MSFKTILTVAEATPSKQDIEGAVELAVDLGAHLSVLLVEVALPPPMGGLVPAAEAWAQIREDQLQRLADGERRAKELLAAAELSSDVFVEFAETVSATRLVGQRGRYADLTLIGSNFARDNVLRRETVGGALFESGRPLLIAPEGRVSLRPKRVLVAWDASSEAARAVRESLDLLIAAEAVHVAIVEPHEGELGHGQEPGADIARYLARHGAKVTVDQLPNCGMSAAEVLRRHVRDCAAELMVMGGYGHTRLRERFFGGVTRSIIEAPAIPTLLAH